MDINIPNENTKRWSGCYQGNYYGDLYRTFNIDLEQNPGHITVSRFLKKIGDTVSLADTTGLVEFTLVSRFIRTDATGTDRWMFSSSRIWKTASTDPDTDWTYDTITSSPFDVQDMTVHENDSDSASGNNILFATRDTDIATLNDTADNSWNRNWWVTTKSMPALKTGSHPIEYFPARRITVIGDGNLLHTIDKNKACTYARITLPVFLTIKHIFVTTYRIWILCNGKFGRSGAVIEWDGSSETYNNIYDVQSEYPLAGVAYYEIPIVVNNRGLILEYNGNGFSPMIRNGQVISFPCYEDIGNAFSAQFIIHPKGMTVTDDGLILIMAPQPGDFSNPSHKHNAGIWCLNPMTGNFYNKYSIGYGTDSDQYGHQFYGRGGPIQSVNIGALSSGASSLLVGGSVYASSVGAESWGVWVLKRDYSGKIRRGYFVTQFLSSNEVQEEWENIWLKYNLLKTTGNKIIVKAKGTDSLLDSNRKPLQKTITWTSQTTFTVTISASDDAISVGDEVEIIAGQNSGRLLHITEISGAQGALQTVTVDESVPAGSSTSYGRFDRWKKIGIIDNQTKYFTPLNIPISSSFLQFKIELRMPPTEGGIKSLMVNSKVQTISKK